MGRGDRRDQRSDGHSEHDQSNARDSGAGSSDQRRGFGPLPHFAATLDTGSGCSDGLHAVVQLHPVFLAQRGQIVAAQRFLLLVAPLDENGIPHGFERLELGRAALRHEHQMKAVAGFDRPLPRAGLERKDLIRKVGAEHPRQCQLVSVDKTVAKQQPVACRRVGFAFRRQLGERCNGIRRCVLTVLRIEVDLSERQPSRRLELRRVGDVKLPQLSLTRFSKLSRILDEELQLLCQTAANDGVVLLEAYLLGLARHQLLVEEIVDETLQLIGAGLAQPLARPGLLQPAHIALADVHRLDGAGVVTSRRLATNSRRIRSRRQRQNEAAVL